MRESEFVLVLFAYLEEQSTRLIHSIDLHDYIALCVSLELMPEEFQRLLSERYVRSRSYTSGMLDHLRKLGFIEGEDGECKLTPAGQRRVEQLRAMLDPELLKQLESKATNPKMRFPGLQKR